MTFETKGQFFGPGRVDFDEDTIFLGDIFARIEELERFKNETGRLAESEAAERARLEGLLASLQDKGRDTGWREHGYPVCLIRDDCFVEHTKFCAEDVYAWVEGVPNFVVIDWEETAENLKADYESVEFEGETFWFPSIKGKLPEEIYELTTVRRGPAFRHPATFKVVCGRRHDKLTP